MDDANESDANLEKAWYLKYFTTVFKYVTDIKTGEIAQVEYYECVVPNYNTYCTPCKAAYIFIPKHGTGNYINYLLNKHGIVKAPVRCYSSKVILVLSSHIRP
jgi:hypothetical protein